MRHLGYAFVAVVCAWSIAVAGPKKPGGANKGKTPAAQTKPAPNVPKQIDPKAQAEIDKVQQEYYKELGKQNHPAMVKLAKKLYDLNVKAAGADSWQAENARVTLAGAYQGAGDLVNAEKLYREHVKNEETKNGVESEQALTAYQLLTSVMYGGNRLDELAGIQQHIIAVQKKLHGDKSNEYASALSNYASTLMQKNEWGATLRTYEEVLKIYEAIGKPDDWSVVGALQSVAMTYWQMNQQAKAVALYDRVIKLAMNPSSTQPFAMRVSTVWVIANQYQYGGRKDLAAPLFKKAIDMCEAELARIEKATPDDWQVSSLLSQLGAMYRYSMDLTKAEQAYGRLEKWSANKGQYSGATVMMAELRRMQGKNKEAIALYEKASAELAKLAPASKNAYDVMIGDIYREMGDYKKAIALYENYKAGMAKLLKNYPASMAGIELMGVTYYAGAGRFKEAETALAHSLEISEKELQNVLRVGTDTDHAIYFSKQSGTLDMPLNFNLNYQPKSGSATRLAMTTVLRRKGRLLDAAAATLATIRAKLSADDKKLLDELNATRAELAKKTVAGPGPGGDTAAFGKEIAALEAKIQKLEEQVSKKSAAYRTVTQPIDLARVQKMIPKDARLVEMINYQPYDTKTTTYAQTMSGNWKNRPRRYLAYIAATTGDPVFVDLGDADPIDKAVEGYRKALADPDNDSIADLGKGLFDLTFAKIAPKLGGATNILMAPDGALNVIPFSALVDDKKEFLIKKYTFTYLTSGRDLLRLQAKTKAQGGGVLFADPKFDDTGTGGKNDTKTRGARSADLATLQWPQLPGTAAEADAILKTFKGLKVYRGEAATEGTIKKIKGPKILHLATHGFFLPDDEKPPEDGNRSASTAVPLPGGMGSVGGGQSGIGATIYENPLLRSGLAFAGANKLVSNDDDGLLTALEASGLDLWGTKLVVLSACETGVGKVTNGDGVYGLRRSLVIAGAESLVMSMWQVDDFATKELMTGFYKRLSEGKGRSEALRATQLELLAKPKYKHPYYWAAFLPAGATTPLKD